MRKRYLNLFFLDRSHLLIWRATEIRKYLLLRGVIVLILFYCQVFFYSPLFPYVIFAKHY